MGEEVEKLKACPFCGSMSSIKHGVGEYWVYCPDCTASGRMTSTPASAMAAWNRRATEAQVEALRKALEEARRIVADRASGGRMLTTRAEANALLEMIATLASSPPESEPVSKADEFAAPDHASTLRAALEEILETAGVRYERARWDHEWRADREKLVEQLVALFSAPAEESSEQAAVEPMAWLVKDFADGRFACTDKVSADMYAKRGHHVQPLYAAPPKADASESGPQRPRHTWVSVQHDPDESIVSFAFSTKDEAEQFFLWALANEPLPAPAEARESSEQPAALRDIAGETVCGFRVAAYRETHPEHGDKYGHRYSEHWSTPSQNPAVKVERLFTEADVRALIGGRDDAWNAWSASESRISGLLEALKAADEALAQVTAFEDDARHIMGNTNFAIVQQRRNQVRAAIDKTAALAPAEARSEQPSCAVIHHKYVGKCPYCHTRLPYLEARPEQAEGEA